MAPAWFDDVCVAQERDMMISFRNGWDIMVQEKTEALRAQTQDWRHGAEGQWLGKKDLELRESESMGSRENRQNVPECWHRRVVLAWSSRSPAWEGYLHVSDLERKWAQKSPVKGKGAGLRREEKKARTGPKIQSLVLPSVWECNSQLCFYKTRGLALTQVRHWLKWVSVEETLGFASVDQIPPVPRVWFIRSTDSGHESTQEPSNGAQMFQGTWLEHQSIIIGLGPDRLSVPPRWCKSLQSHDQMHSPRLWSREGVRFPAYITACLQNQKAACVDPCRQDVMQKQKLSAPSPHPHGIYTSTRASPSSCLAGISADSLWKELVHIKKKAAILLMLINFAAVSLIYTSCLETHLIRQQIADWDCSWLWCAHQCWGGGIGKLIIIGLSSYKIPFIFKAVYNH